MHLVRGILPGAKKVVIYGPEGIGKTTFASKFPLPVFCDTEGSTKALEVARFDVIKDWQDVFDAIKFVEADPSCCKTFVLDTADWAEMLCIKYTCQKGGVNGIEDFGYGKGYTYAQENFKKLLDELNKLIELGINVVVTAHAKMRKFEQPDEMGAYDRWEMKLTRQIAPMLKEWADMVLFANYKTYVVEDDKTKSKKAQGGKRVMYTTHNPCWDAKNRYGLSDCVDFDYNTIKEIIEGKAKEPETVPAKKEKSVKEEAPTDTPKAKEPEVIVPEHIKKLKELMAKDGIEEDRLVFALASKGICFTGERLENIDPVFLKENVIGQWAGFSKYAKKLDMNMEEIQFN